MDAGAGDGLRRVAKGTRGELARCVEALATARLRGWIRPRAFCPPAAARPWRERAVAGSDQARAAEIVLRLVTGRG